MTINKGSSLLYFRNSVVYVIAVWYTRYVILPNSVSDIAKTWERKLSKLMFKEIKVYSVMQIIMKWLSFSHKTTPDTAVSAILWVWFLAIP